MAGEITCRALISILYIARWKWIVDRRVLYRPLGTREMPPRLKCVRKAQEKGAQAKTSYNHKRLFRNRCWDRVVLSRSHKQQTKSQTSKLGYYRYASCPVASRHTLSIQNTCDNLRDSSLRQILRLCSDCKKKTSNKKMAYNYVIETPRLEVCWHPTFQFSLLANWALVVSFKGKYSFEFQF